MLDSLVIPSHVSGGAHTSRTMMLADLSAVLDYVPPGAASVEYKAAVIEHNCLGKGTLTGRQRAYRYLRELYALDPGSLVFRALRDLWVVDPESRPLLALLSALARDPVLRATASAVLSATEGSPVDAAMLARAVQDRYPDSYGDGITAKIGRNTASSWTQSGHLVGRTHKKRVRANATPTALAYALLIGHTEGLRGDELFNSEWCRILDRPAGGLLELAIRASQRGLIDYRHGGGVTEVGYKLLLRPSVAAEPNPEKRHHVSAK